MQYAHSITCYAVMHMLHLSICALSISSLFISSSQQPHRSVSICCFIFAAAEMSDVRRRDKVMRQPFVVFGLGLHFLRRPLAWAAVFPSISYLLPLLPHHRMTQ